MSERRVDRSRSRVLVVSYSFPPASVAASLRPYSLARFLPDAGWSPVVLTTARGDETFDAGEWGGVRGEARIVRVEPWAIGARARRGGGPRGDGGSTVATSRLRRRLGRWLVPDKGLPWVLGCLAWLRRAPGELDGVDRVLSTSPLFSNHVVGRAVARRLGVPWVVDFRDFHYLHAREWSRPPGLGVVDRRLEGSVLGEADLATFISEPMRAAYERRYGDLLPPTAVIPNGFDPEEFGTTVADEGAGERFVVFYAGSFYGGDRSPAPLFAAVRKAAEMGLLQPAEIEVRVAGVTAGVGLEALAASAPGLRLDLLGVVNRADVLRQMRRSDALWLIVSDHPAHSVGFPVKGFEYFGARRPVLGFVPAGTEAARILQQYPLGVAMESATDGAGVERNAVRLGDMVRRWRSGTGPAVDGGVLEAALRPFDRREQAGVFARLLDSVTRRRGGATRARGAAS